MKEVTKERFKEVTNSIPPYISATLGDGCINYVNRKGNSIGVTEKGKYYLIDSLAHDIVKTRCVEFARFVTNGNDHFNNGSSMEMVYDEWVKKTT